MSPRATSKAEYEYMVNLSLTKAQKRQLRYVAQYHEMNERDLLRALIKREALKLYKKGELE